MVVSRRCNHGDMKRSTARGEREAMIYPLFYWRDSADTAVKICFKSSYTILTIV